jgi:hypothetical protein
MPITLAGVGPALRNQISRLRPITAGRPTLAATIPTVTHPGKFLHLLKGLYGLKQAARLWHQELRDYMISIGYTVSELDEAVFINEETGHILTSYVDDLLTFGEEEEATQVENSLSEKFDIKHTGECTK